MKVCVFCSSSDAVSPEYFEAATRLGSLLGSGGHALVFGGGQVGLMGAVARAAKSAGSSVIGVLPLFMNRPGVPFLECDELIYAKDMRERKARMMEMAEAFIALPGGFGTLEELSEVITQKQFGFIRGPLVLVNTFGFYDPLASFFEGFYERLFAKPAFRSVCAFVPTPEEAMGYIRGYSPEEPVSKWF